MCAVNYQNSLHNSMPVIFSCEGEVLSESEREFFKYAQPTGFILFGRNIKTVEQTMTLVRDLKESLGPDRKIVPILIDEEGGLVDRLKALDPPTTYPAARTFGVIAECLGIDVAKIVVDKDADLISARLAKLGINVNCAPVADLYNDDTGTRGSGEKNPAIRTRSFTDDVEIVTELSESFIEAQHRNNIISVVKHMPGHGLAIIDSHKGLPIITRDLQYLKDHDFKVFDNLHDSGAWGMVAHIVYNALDPNNAATQSKPAVDYLREELHFSNVLLSDGIEMEALTGTLGERSVKGIEAGLDLILYSNGKIDEMQEIIDKLHSAGIDHIDETSANRILSSFGSQSSYDSMSGTCFD